MKRCPECGNTYTDDSLRYCLADGAALVFAPDDDATWVSAKREGVQTDARRLSRDVVPPAAAAPPSRTKVALVIGSVAFFILFSAAIAGALLYFNRDSRKAGSLTTPTPVAVISAATPDAERQKLLDQIANIQKQLDEKKAVSRDDPTNASSAPEADTAVSTTARVNSPNDGFLALRDKPHAQLGKLVERIPHGARVRIEKCGPLQRRLGGRLGRWCVITYEGQSGFVFDAFLDRE